MSLFGPEDDRLHLAAMSDRWWETETAWFSFSEPSRALGGWLYVLIRPNIGTVAGGAWVWDASASLPWEVCYSANYTALKLPEGLDLADAELPTGVRIRALEPLLRYEIGYRDEGRFTANLEFEAVMPPLALTRTDSAFGHLSHFDQFGRVTGRLELYGETIPIDCLSMRDRSWGPRPEHRPRRGTYVTGIASPAHGFLALTEPRPESDEVSHGFLLRDGRPVALRSGRRAVISDPVEGWTREIVVEGVDIEGREFQARGTVLSRIVINRHTFIDVNSLVTWSLDGEAAHGEDQDMWPVWQWAEAARARRTGQLT